MDTPTIKGIVFISGPYTARNWFKKVLNIIRARKEAKRWWRLGYAVICPHSNTAFFDGIVPDEVFYEGCCVLVKLCNILVLLKGSSKSYGAVMEYKTAILNNITVVNYEKEPI